MDFVSNTESQIQEMLKTLGVSSIEALLKSIPPSLLLSPPKEEDGMSESEGIALVQSIGAKSQFSNFKSYLGAGAYEHYVPALVQAVCQKSEFLTAYTPYQAEASQGLLQAIFEFQSAICLLTGMDIANASVYDGASACAEGVLMALRLKPDCTKVYIAESFHPFYQEVVKTYLRGKEVEILKIPFTSEGTLDQEFLQKGLKDQNGIVLIQSPNFFGCIEDVAEVSSKVHAKGGLVVLCANPLAYGVFASAGEVGADIAVGDCQPFGIPLQFGGPYAGYIACRKEFVRQMPGRIVGQTQDNKGNRGFVLTLQTREQHIRREKATSNLCTNQALAALASLVAMLWYGKQGIKELALTNFQRTAYLKQQLHSLPGCHIMNPNTNFNEFAIKFSKPLEEVFSNFRKAHIEPGVKLERFFPQLKDYLLVCVTEMKSQKDLDAYVSVAKQIGNSIKPT